MTERNPPASPTCYLPEPPPIADVAPWRQAERRRLLEARAALPVEARARIAAALARHLDALIAALPGGIGDRVLGGYWPIRSEPDLRPWMTALHAQGVRLALPVVATRAAPLVFRPWSPGAPMRRGHWNILEPDTDAEIRPGIVLAPLVGWDGEGFRLGYGGGYFDRTLAALAPRPLAIGTGLQAARLDSIRPQPHDIRLDAIVTEAGRQA